MKHQATYKLYGKVNYKTRRPDPTAESGCGPGLTVSYGIRIRDAYNAIENTRDFSQRTITSTVTCRRSSGPSTAHGTARDERPSTSVPSRTATRGEARRREGATASCTCSLQMIRLSDHAKILYTNMSCNYLTVCPRYFCVSFSLSGEEHQSIPIQRSVSCRQESVPSAPSAREPRFQDRRSWTANERSERFSRVSRCGSHMVLRSNEEVVGSSLAREACRLETRWPP